MFRTVMFIAALGLAAPAGAATEAEKEAECALQADLMGAVQTARLDRVRKSKVAEMLDRFSLVAKQKLFPRQLSGGQQQLVGVARALIIEPRVILADEPTGNLQSEQSEEIMETLQGLNERDNVTIVQVTHSEKQAQYGNRIVKLDDGRIESDVSTKERVATA